MLLCLLGRAYAVSGFLIKPHMSFLCDVNNVKCIAVFLIFVKNACKGEFPVIECQSMRQYTQSDFCAWCRKVVQKVDLCGRKQPMEVYYERYFNETVIRSRCSLWTSDKKMEP